MRHTLVTVSALLTTVLATAAGCATNTDEGAVSAEANLDAFARPTMHGALAFDRANEAAFTSDQRFHAWTFTLSGPADLELLTDLRTQNLDTVVYLYRKGQRGWGQSIASNDNAASSSLASRIAGHFEAGDYMLKVKARHISMRGDFAVTGQCTGAGCPAAAAECAAPPPAFPSGVEATSACAATMAAILATPRGHSASAACDASVSQAAHRYYENYFRDFGDEVWEEMLSEDGVDERFTHHPGAGTVAHLDAGGDESAMSYVFDAQQRPILYYQHNQTAEWAWSCDGDPLPEAEQPDDACIAAMLGHHDYGPADVREGRGDALAGTPAGVSPQVDAAVEEYAAGVPAGTELSFTFRSWDRQYEKGAEVKVRAEGSPETTYVVVGSPGWGTTVAVATTEGKSRFVCNTTY